MRNVGVVIGVVGDRPITEYSTIDAGRVRDAMISKGLAVLSVRTISSAEPTQPPTPSINGCRLTSVKIL